jgi:hypothetical protein
MMANKTIPSSHACSRGFGKYEASHMVIANGQLYPAYHGSSELIQFPIRPSPSAIGRQTASMSVISKNL